MKKILALLMAMIMVMGMAACGSSNNGSSTTTTTTTTTTTEPATTEPAKEEPYTIKEGVLTCVTSPDYAPYEFYTVENGEYKLAGFDMALAQYIADYCGLELEVIPMDFDGTLAEMAAGTSDIAICALSPTDERKEKMDFSDLYYFADQTFISTKENAQTIKTLEDANKPEISVGAQNGAIQVELAETNTPKADIVRLQKVTDIIAELISGKLDGAYVESSVATTYCNNYPELTIVCEVPYDGSHGSGVAVKKGNTVLLQKVNEAIAKCLEDGSMDGFIKTAFDLSAGENVYEGLVEK